MPASRVQLRIEVETEGAEQLTTLREELNRVGKAGTAAFTQLDRSLTAVVDNLQLSRRVVADSTRSFLDSQRQLFTGLTPLFDSFFRTVLTGSRSLRDALQRLWRDFLDFFLGLVRRMVAAWLGGLRAMGGAPRGLPGFGGGILGGILGGLFGLPAQAGLPGLGIPLGTPPTFPGLLPSLGLGLVLGPGGRVPTIGGAGGITGTVLGGGLGTLGGVAGLLGLAGFGLLAGGGPLRRGIGGFLAGGALGTLIGGTGALAGTAIGAFAGPIGAIVGAILGGLFGAFSRGKKKRGAARVADEGFAAMRRVVEEFERFMIDFESAIAQVNSIWAQMVAAWQQIGGVVGRRSIRGQEPFFRQIVERINRIQKARELRAEVVAGLPIPEFQFGGMVRAISAHNGRILALLHEGEAVLNRRAVRALGETQITRLNREPSRALAEGPITVQFVFPGVVDPRGIRETVTRMMPEIERGIRRAARDRGLRPPL